jgi:hypothetical protein
MQGKFKPWDGPVTRCHDNGEKTADGPWALCLSGPPWLLAKLYLSLLVRSPNLGCRMVGMGKLRSPSHLFRQLDPFFLSRDPQFIESSRLDLPHALFRDTHLVPDFFERLRFLAVIQPEATNDNFLLPFVKAR